MGGFLLGTDPTLRKTKTPTVNTFTHGDGFTAGSSTSVTLTADPGAEQHLTVFFDGVGQHRSTYSVSGTTLTFDTAIPTGTAEVEATYASSVPSVTVPDNSVATAKIADNAVTLAKLAGGTDGNIISFDASGDPVAIATGNDGQVLTSTGAGSPPAFEAVSASFTQGTEQATTSGTDVTFGSIPAGTKMIVISYMGVKSDADADVYVQIGDSGGIETSGYLGDNSNLSSATPATSGSTTTTWDINKHAAADVIHGIMILVLADASNVWTQNHVLAAATGKTYWGAGQKPLSAELTQVKIGIASGSFTEGSVNIMYM